MSSEWVCMPCYSMVPYRDGTLTVHGDTEPDYLTVWCPWCGDAMDQADVVLEEGEL